MTFSLDGGTISGGSVNAAVGIAHGVTISTSGSGSNIEFELVNGTINGGTGLSLGHGVRLNATGGSNIDGTVNATVNATNEVGGIGLNVGLLATATGGNGYVDLEVGEDGEVNGAAAGVIGAAAGSGTVTIDIYGDVNQVSDDAGEASFSSLVPVGVGGVSTGSGLVTVTTHAGSQVNQVGALPIGDGGVEGIGVLALNRGSGGATATANGNVSATGFGVASATFGSGNAETNVGGDISVNGATGPSALGLLGFGTLGNGTVGALALSGSGTATVNLNGGNILGSTPDIGLAGIVLAGANAATVNVDPNANNAAVVHANLVGVLGFNLGSGDVVVTETPYVDPITSAVTYNTINSDGIGILGVAAGGGNVSIESGTVVSGADGITIPVPILGPVAISGGVLGAGFGNVDISTLGDTTTGGMVGVGALAGGNVEIDLNGTTVTANSGIGVGAIAFGDAVIKAQDSTISSGETGILVFGNNAAVDAGAIASTNGSGVIATAIGGNAVVNVQGKIQADNGFYGAAAFATDGDATVTVNAAIDPPAIGASSVTVGAGTATVINNSDVEADFIGLAGANFGSGSVVITNHATVGTGVSTPPTFGISTLNIGGAGDTTITNNNTVIGDTSAIALLHFADGDAVIDNTAGSLLQGNGILGPVIMAGTSNGLTINNAGTIRGNMTAAGDPIGPFEPLIVSIGGGGTTVNNAAIGDLHGNVTLIDFSGEGNVVNNAGLWETGGVNTLLSGSGNDAINNTGTVETNLLTLFAVDNFNNHGGLVTTTDNDIGEQTVITGNFNASGISRLGFDAALALGGTADVMTVGGSVSGVTLVQVNDLAPGPGAYDPQGVLFALVSDGGTNGDDFTTGGGIDKGLFRYEAMLRPDTVEIFGEDYQQWVLASTPDVEAYEFPVIMSGANALWNQSTGTWLERTADLRSTLGGVALADTPVDLKNEGAVATPAPANMTPAMWAKVFGATEQRDFVNASTIGDTTFVYQDNFEQNFYGFMAGIDGGKEFVDGAWMVGLMAGYAGSSLDFDAGTSVDYTAGSIGAYATYLKGGLFVDVAVKADFGKIDYETWGGSFDSDYTAIGGVIDAGYRIDMASGWFIEPKATLSYVHTEIDNAAVLGTGVVFDDGDSLRGRLGARIGTRMDRGDTVFEPYIEANVWNEFEGDYSSSLISGPYTLPFGFDNSGVYGEVSLGANVFNAPGGWNAFAKGTVSFGEDSFLGLAGQAGFRKAF